MSDCCKRRGGGLGRSKAPGAWSPLPSCGGGRGPLIVGLGRDVVALRPGGFRGTANVNFVSLAWREESGAGNGEGTAGDDADSENAFGG